MKMSPPHDRLAKLIKFLIPYWWLIIGVVLGLTVISLPRAVKLMTTISTQLADLLPESYPSIAHSNEIKQKFSKKGGGGGDLIFMIESPDPEINLKLVNDIAAYIESHPSVEKVETKKRGYDFFDKYKLLYLDLKDINEIHDRIDRKIQQEKLGGLYVDFGGEGDDDDLADGDKKFTFEDMMKKYREEYDQGISSPYHTNQDGTIYALWIFPKSKDGSLKYFKTFYEEMTGHINQFDFNQYATPIQTHYAGSVRTRLDEYKSLMGDLTLAGIISMAGIFALLIFYYFDTKINWLLALARSVIRVVLVFLPLICGVSMAFAISSFFISTLNVVTSFLFSILFGLGVDIGIHLMARYLEDKRDGVPFEQRIVNFLLHTGRSSATAAFTTIATFLLLLINDFRGFSEFGFIAGFGLAVILLTYFILFPAIIIMAEKLNLIGDESRRLIEEEVKTKVFPHARAVCLTCIALLVGFMAVLPFVGFEWNYGVLRMHIPATVLAKEKLNQVKGRVNRPATVMIENRAEAEALKNYFETKKKNESQTSIDKFWSSYDLVPPQQAEKIARLKEIEFLLADDALNFLDEEDKGLVDQFRASITKTQLLNPEDIPDTVREIFFGGNEFMQAQLAYIYPKPKMELDDGRFAMRFFDDVHETKVSGKTFYAVSDAIIFADVLETMFADSKRTIILSIICMVVLLMVDLKSIRHTSLVMLALFFGMAGMLAITYLMGWKFNFFNMITIPTVIGMGEDNSVHIFNRYKELGGKSVMAALRSSGSAALMASLTTLIGFVGLIFAHHPGLKSIGIFAVVGMTTCMIGSLVFFPAILEVTKKRINS